MAREPGEGEEAIELGHTDRVVLPHPRGDAHHADGLRVKSYRMCRRQPHLQEAVVAEKSRIRQPPPRLLHCCQRHWIGQCSYAQTVLRSYNMRGEVHEAWTSLTPGHKFAWRCCELSAELESRSACSSPVKLQIKSTGLQWVTISR